MGFQKILLGEVNFGFEMWWWKVSDFVSDFFLTCDVAFAEFCRVVEGDLIGGVQCSHGWVAPSQFLYKECFLKLTWPLKWSVAI